MAIDDRPRITPWIFVAALIVADCTTPATPTIPAPTAESQACRPASLSAAGPGTVRVGTRTVFVYVPSGFHESDRPALVLILHGTGMTGISQQDFSGMNDSAQQNRFIAAYPQAAIPATSRVGGNGYDWNVPGGTSFSSTSGDDVAFLKQAIAELELAYCTDPSRIFVTGYSAGGRMAGALVCVLSEAIAAVAVVDGLQRPPCRQGRSVPIIAFHGAADPIVPYAGGAEAFPDAVVDAVQGWAERNVCGPRPTVDRSTAGAEHSVFDCPLGAEVELYTLAGAGHTWPGGPHLATTVTKTIGPESSAIDANAVIWRFFAAHPLPLVSVDTAQRSPS